MDKILLVEDEEKLRSELKIFLENSGFKVLELKSFDNTIDDIINFNSDLILLDINIPNLNGEIVCKEVRKRINTPIIIVTSRNSEIDELISINYGADDFITKPYNTQILLARIERLLKRSNNLQNNIKYKELSLDLSKSIIMKGDLIIDLSKNEFKILYFLITNKNKIVARDELMNYLWNTNEFIDDNTLTVNINRLRKKLENLGYKNIITTKRGQGYILL
jgi:DNA-binding response OmpR family regulator